MTRSFAEMKPGAAMFGCPGLCRENKARGDNYSFQ